MFARQIVTQRRGKRKRFEIDESRFMDSPHRRTLGSAFSVFGFGLTLVLRVAPMVRWQPSHATAVGLLCLGFICMAGGPVMFFTDVIRSGAMVYLTLFRRWKSVALWSFAMLALAFMAWQSIPR